jgi:hypothetical protein
VSEKRGNNHGGFRFSELFQALSGYCRRREGTFLKEARETITKGMPPKGGDKDLRRHLSHLMTLVDLFEVEDAAISS